MCNLIKILASVFKKQASKRPSGFKGSTLVKVQHKIPRDGTHIVKEGGKYFKIKELG